MRETFSDCIVEIASAHPEVLMFTGDHGYALFDRFRRDCASQFINAGIAEQNMVGLAAGVARLGFRPFVYGLSAFIPVRVLEQIKLDVAHDRLPVIFFGDGAGLVYSHLGTSHQSTEDIACARAIPDLNVLSPCDRHELRAVIGAAFDLAEPCYIRLGKADLGDIHDAPPAIAPGKLLALKTSAGRGVSFIATGSMVHTARKLAGEFGAAQLWSAPWLKPLDAGQVSAICRGSDAVVVMEEHSTAGGLGSAVAEIASEYSPVRILRIGVPDRFSQHCGTWNYLLKEHGIDIDNVADRIRRFLAEAPAR